MSALAVSSFAEAQAVAICWIANVRGPVKPRGWDGLHSAECGWCVYPPGILLAAVEAYNASPDVEEQRARFFRMGSRARRMAIRIAQGYENIQGEGTR